MMSEVQQPSTRSLRAFAASPALAGSVTFPFPTLLSFLSFFPCTIPEMYELSGPPFIPDKRDPKCLVDRRGEQVILMGASREILLELATHDRWNDTQVQGVGCTRTLSRRSFPLRRVG
jgi:hypothetical protein